MLATFLLLLGGPVRIVDGHGVQKRPGGATQGVLVRRTSAEVAIHAICVFFAQLRQSAMYHYMSICCEIKHRQVLPVWSFGAGPVLRRRLLFGLHPRLEVHARPARFLLARRRGGSLGRRGFLTGWTKQLMLRGVAGPALLIIIMMARHFNFEVLK